MNAFVNSPPSVVQKARHEPMVQIGPEDDDRGGEHHDEHGDPPGIHGIPSVPTT